jgi:DUF2934 family protein
MKNIVEQVAQVDEAAIGLLAYQLWEQAGHPAGRDQEFWFQAEKRLRAIIQPAAAAPVVRLSNTGPAKVTPTTPKSQTAQRPLGLPGSATVRRNHNSTPVAPPAR